MKIYLAGSVPKGDEEQKTFADWRARYQSALESIFDAEYIDPYDRVLDESDFLLVVGKDCIDIIESSLVIVNAEEKLGAGTAQELVIAKYLKKPVVTVLPKNTPHRRTNIMFNGQLIDDWIHPFIFTFSDFVIEDIEKIEEIKDKIFDKHAVKDISIIDTAVEHFRNKQNMTQKIAHDSEISAHGRQAITACAFIYHNFNGIEKVFLPKRAETKKFLPDINELPGGHINFGEDIVDGLKREIFEELGMRITVGDPFACFTYMNEIKGSHSLEVIYFAQFIDSLEKITLHPDDHSSFGWYAENELAGIIEENRHGDDPEINVIRKGFSLLAGSPTAC